MQAVLLPVAALLFSVALLITGHGLQLTLLPLAATALGWSETAISLTAAGYFSGFILGCLVTPLLVRRVGHIRTFAVLATSASTIILLHTLTSQVGLWTLLRLGTGFCLSGLYMVVESWLNERSTPETRGTLLSFYTVVNLTMLLAGQGLLNATGLADATPFVVAGIFLSLAIVPVGLTTTLQPQPLHRIRFPFRQLLARTPAALVGALVAGLANGAFWALAPVYARDAGLDTAGTTLFISAAIVGGALAQLPLGRLSDRGDRRRVILGVCGMGAVLSVLLGLMQQGGRGVLLGLGAGWGACAMSIYALCVAHASDHADANDFVAVGGGVLMTYGIGSVAGPLIVPLVLVVAGSGAVFWVSAWALGLGALYILARVLRFDRPIEGERTPFVLVPEATQEAFVLDPRAEEETLNREELGIGNP